MLLLFVLITNNNVFAANANAVGEYATDLETFDIPGHGELIISIPRIWNYNFTKTDDETPPLITFYVLDNNEEEIFQLNMSVFWDDGFNRKVTSPEYIYSLVEGTGEKALALSDQTELNLKEIKGKNGIGYLYDLSDNSAKKGEYHYLTQGALAVGEVLVVFSLFSNDEKAILREAMLRSLKSARHRFRNDV